MIMGIVKCVNGHYYDAAKTKACPYCKERKEKQRGLQYSLQGQRFGRESEKDSINSAATAAALRESPQELELTGFKKNISAGVPADHSQTVGYYSRYRGNAYVTGWLVATEGPAKGRDFRILHGMNRIGRSSHMDICISEDDEIAEKNCTVVYDGKSNSFFVAAERGALTYLNGQLLTEARRLKLGDEIAIGRSRLEFVPFCREGHVWDEK